MIFVAFYSNWTAKNHRGKNPCGPLFKWSQYHPLSDYAYEVSCRIRVVRVTPLHFALSRRTIADSPHAFGWYFAPNTSTLWFPRFPFRETQRIKISNTRLNITPGLRFCKSLKKARKSISRRIQDKKTLSSPVLIDYHEFPS
ncbi:hypothetical protein D3C78_1201830 [compost metagenome]